MHCDPVSWVCEINLGAIVLVLFFALAGISVTFYGVAEDVQDWWMENSYRLEELLDNLRNKFRF
jgi:hypothetical protein